MRIKVDSELCQGHGLCILTAPELFHMNEIEHAEVSVADVPEALSGEAATAIGGCPEGAISEVDE